MQIPTSHVKSFPKNSSIGRGVGLKMERPSLFKSKLLQDTTGSNFVV